MGHEKGEYQYCSPNDHCNCGQSTNDVYPTTIRYALIRMNAHLVGALTGLISAFRYKADEYSDVINMGGTAIGCNLLVYQDTHCLEIIRGINKANEKLGRNHQ